MQLKKVVHFLVFCISITGYTQENFPSDYFSNPLEIDPILAGTFAELRSNHFHSGVDIKTQQREGLNVLAAADGHVSRIKISPWGYGKALYIAHPNGYTSVYAHLKKFAPEIEAYVKKHQYEKESYAIELFPKVGELKVTKQDLVAYSGNSGSSGGPHLHYEIRDSQQRPINPMLFGFEVKDHKKPSINGVYAYSLNDTTQVNHHNSKLKIKLTKTKDGNYISNTVYGYGIIGFGVNTFDQQDQAYNKNGVYNIKTYQNGKLNFELDFKKFAFSETRYLNRLIDYAHFKKHKSRIQKLFKEPNNPLSIIKNVDEKGHVYLNEGDHINYKVIITDFKNNQRTITIPLVGKKQEITHFKKKEESPHYIYANKGISMDHEGKSVYIPKNAVYDNQHITFETMGDTITIGHEGIPLHKNMTISFNSDKYEKDIISKLFVSQLKYKKPYYVSTYKKEHKIVGKTKNLGTFTLSLDTVAPKITPLNVYEGKWMSKSKYLKVKIVDKLSGIKKYRATINGKWILMEYDAKNNLLTYDFSDGVNNTTSENKFKLIVIDNVGNNSTFDTIFYRKN